jgi:hypothetical protein
MKQRCNNPKHKRYYDYGGRGITYDSRWEKFENFLEDMGKCPGPEYTIGRIDNDNSYCRENCRWETMRQQSRNKRNSKKIIFNKESLCLVDWAAKTGISASGISYRLNKLSMPPPREALTVPAGEVKSHIETHEAFGERGTLKELSKKFNIKYCTIHRRLRNGSDLEDALSKPTEEKYLYGNKMLTLRQISELCGINYEALRKRIKRYKWTMERATTTPIYRRHTEN